MSQRPETRRFVITFVSVATLIAAVALLVALSYEILWGNRTHFSSGYMTLQLVVCVIFLLDFAVRIVVEEQRWRFLRRNILFLLLSIPYLNILHWLGVPPPRSWSLALMTIPILRMLMAVYLVARWLVEDSIRRLFTAYAFTLLLFTYMSALIFYDFEFGSNSGLADFGDALWWAFMNMTTVGSSIMPTTIIGKVLAVLLPLLGMLVLPLFTVYISNLFTHNKKESV